MLTFGPPDETDTDDQRLDPCVWLALVGLICLIVALISVVATRNVGPTAVVLGLAAIPCLGFGIGAIAGENGRGRLEGVGGVLALLGLLVVWLSAPRPTHHHCGCHHHCHHR